MMNHTAKLISRLPKKYRDRVHSLEPWGDLIDDCKFMLEFNFPYAWEDYYSVPVKSITEAIQFVKESCISEYELEHAGDR